MTYGYRLNVEHLMLRRANTKFDEAKKRMVEVPDSVPEYGETYFFKGPGFEDDETIALCIEAFLGWAVSFEAFVNLVWNSQALRRWVWNSPPELGQDMTSTTTGGMAWTAPRF